jgi:hypothetical protein
MSLHAQRIEACLLLACTLVRAEVRARVDASRRCVRVERVGRPVVCVWPLLRTVAGEPRYLVESDGSRAMVGPVGLLREVR